MYGFLDCVFHYIFIIIDRLRKKIALHLDFFLSLSDTFTLLEVSPNPSSKFANLNLALVTKAKECTIQIMDASGHVHISDKVIKVKNITKTFDLGNLTNGLYFLKVSTQTGVDTKRFVLCK